MRAATARFASVVAFAVVIEVAAVGCSSKTNPSTGTPTEPTTSHFLLPDTANPSTATFTFESGATSALVTTDGGVLTTTGEDGTVYTLTVPADALVTPATITMTPIRSVTGIAAAKGRWIGVRLDPEGLQFWQPVSLRMVPVEGEAVHAFGFSSLGDGREFHGQPLVADATRIEMPLFHFSSSITWVCGRDCGSSVQAPEPGTPTDWEARLQSYIQSYLEKQREDALAKKPIDPNWADTIEAVYREYWNRVIEPLLAHVVDDCSFMEANIGRVLSWQRGVDLFNLGSRFTSEEDRVRRSLLAGIENCYVQASKPCIDKGNVAQMQTLVTYQRQADLLTSGNAPFNIMVDKDRLACGTFWTGTAHVVFPNSFETRSVFVLEVEKAASTDTVWSLRVKSGSVTLQVFQSDGGCTTRMGPQTFTLVPDDGQITFFPDVTGGTLSAIGELVPIAGRTAPFRTTCIDGRDFTQEKIVGGSWLEVSDGTPAFPDGKSTMSFSYSYAGFVNEWSFTR